MNEKPYHIPCPICNGDTVIRWGLHDKENLAETRCLNCGLRTGFLDFNILKSIVNGQWTYDDAADFHIDCARRALEFMEKKRGDRK